MQSAACPRLPFLLSVHHCQPPGRWQSFQIYFLFLRSRGSYFCHRYKHRLFVQGSLLSQFLFCLTAGPLLLNCMLPPNGNQQMHQVTYRLGLVLQRIDSSYWECLITKKCLAITCWEVKAQKHCNALLLKGCRLLIDISWESTVTVPPPWLQQMRLYVLINNYFLLVTSYPSGTLLWAL